VLIQRADDGFNAAFFHEALPSMGLYLTVGAKKNPGWGAAPVSLTFSLWCRKLSQDQWPPKANQT
jgi:hypothetical protein